MNTQVFHQHVAKKHLRQIFKRVSARSLKEVTMQQQLAHSALKAQDFAETGFRLAGNCALLGTKPAPINYPGHIRD